MTDKRRDVVKRIDNLVNFQMGLRNIHHEMTYVPVYLCHLKYNSLNICAQVCIRYDVHNKAKYPLRLLCVTCVYIPVEIIR